MKIAVIGTGNIGGSLARLWIRHGHSVILGVTSEEKAAEARKAFAGAEVRLVKDAADGAEVVVLAVPWTAAEAALKELGSVAGKVLVDTSNPVTADLSGLQDLGGKSAGEMVQQWRQEARVVKAFNTLGAAYLGNGKVAGSEADGFLCGDDAAAKATVATLVGQAGLSPVDVGPLRNARYLEAVAMLWIDMAVIQRRVGRFAFKLLSED